MVRMRQLRNRSWWARLVAPVRRLRQEPGWANLARFDSLVRRIVQERVLLRGVPAAELAGMSGGLRALDLGEDEEIILFLAVASEIARRRLGTEPYEEQLRAAVSMLRAQVVDMATGEGKTLVGFLVAAGCAVAGRRVHVLSANDYLAGRDAAGGRALFDAFGLSCAAVVDGMGPAERRHAYRAGIVYTTVHQVGFDMLRDRQRTAANEPLLPALDTAVVDEIDAVLIDDAMVPLVLAGEAEADTGRDLLTAVVAEMRAGVEYEVNGERRAVSFTEAGIDLLEARLGVDNLFAEGQTDLLTAANVTLHAHALLERDVHYVVVDGQVRLINDARGRVADRQRWPDGLHAAVERKEGIAATHRAEVLDQVLVETVARAYGRLTGMSGTALEAAERLAEDLQLRTGTVPTHRPCVRIDEPDRLHVTAEDRDAAAAGRVCEAHRVGRPVLVGTTSVAASERFAALLEDRRVMPMVLNAKNDAAEAKIIARAGQLGAITVSTQMAGRGVDIALGEGVPETGGLLVLGLERCSSARLDRQLRGRAGRQGDPGGSVFYTSMEDDVLVENLVVRRTPRSVDPEGRITDAAFGRLYEHAQRVAEGRLLQLHRTTRSYHTATDRQRRLVLETRDRLLACPAALERYLEGLWPGRPDEVRRWSQPGRRQLATDVVLYQLDRAWTDHLEALAEVREGIHLRALGRQNPLDAFRLVAAQSFREIASGVEEATRSVLEHADDDTADLADLGLRRPSSTWTYMVTDNPFGSEADRVVGYVGRLIRGGRPPGVSYT